ncbi:MAG: capsular polysaccharide synthesis protein [Bacteroidota bacterium]
MQIPQKIWFLWLQGFDDMPHLVRKCWTSWLTHHPDWEIIFLDKNNLYDYVNIKTILEDRSTIIYAASQSDIIRINLLRRYGGVWVDATCFCQRPLESWLPDYLAAGFFAFHRPGYDRMLSSWFLAATADNLLVEAYCATVNEFWKNNQHAKMWQDRPWIYRLLLKFKIHGYLKKNPTLWFHPLMLKGLKIYPYFWFFYLFEKIYHENPTVKKLWDMVPKYSADIPHKLQHHGILQPLSASLQQDIDQRVDPLYKLTYKYDASKLTSETTLDYLLNTI